MSYEHIIFDLVSRAICAKYMSMCVSFCLSTFSFLLYVLLFFTCLLPLAAVASSIAEEITHGNKVFE